MWKHFRWRQLAPSLAKIVLSCGIAGLIFLIGGQLWGIVQDTLPVPGGTVGALAEIMVVGGLGGIGFVMALWLLRAFDPDEQESIKAMLHLRRRRP